MSKVIMIRTAQGLTPADQHQWEELYEDRLPIGSSCEVTIKRPRNLKFHRLFFAMLKTTFDMQDEFEDFDHWRLVCQIGAGAFTAYKIPDPDRKLDQVADVLDRLSHQVKPALEKHAGQIKRCANRVREIGSQETFIPKSISFDKMDETEFRRLKEKVLTFIAGRYINDTPEGIDAILQFS